MSTIDPPDGAGSAPHPPIETDDAPDVAAEDLTSVTECGADEDPSEDHEVPQQALADFIASATSDGLYPAVAFGLDPNGAPSRIGLLTSSIVDFPFALEIVERVNREPVTPYRFVPLSTVEYIASKNAIMSLKEIDVPGFNSADLEHKKAFSRLFAYCTASRWASRAFLLVDMVSFSQESTPRQLALRMSLGQAVSTCLRRMYRLQESGLIRSRRFNRISTGDGFYAWNYDWSTEGHVATFVLLVLLVSHIEAMYQSGSSSLRLRAAFGIGEAYTFPYNGPGNPPRKPGGGFMPDAIGPALNDLSRLLSAAAPGQILVSPFSEPGRPDRPGESLNVSTMLTRVRAEILPAELGPADPVKSHDILLATDPERPLRITDKHGVVHHCYNVHGRIPNRRGDEMTLQSLGLVPDEARDIDSVPFKGAG